MNLNYLLTRKLTFLISIIVVSACSSESKHTALPIYNLTVFEPCEDASGLDCGSFEVPLIHDSTDNRQLSIHVARLPGTGDGPHEPLLFIEGGPGSGTEVLREFAQLSIFPDAIRERYDIIGFDARGVRDPLQLDCDQLGNAKSIPYPRDRSDVKSLVTDYTMLADSCSAEYADQLQWVGSNAVVQDMEVMRTMLNAPELNIIATSFGTRIAALYLERFPDTSGRIILDAPLPPNGKIDSLLLDSTAAQQANFDLMLAACGTSLPDCDRGEIEAAFVTRVNKLLDQEDIDTFRALFKLLAISIEEPEVGELLAPVLIDYATSGDPMNIFTIIEDFGLNEEDDGSLTLERAVMCADDVVRPNVESLLIKLGSLNISSDLFAESVLPMAAQCAGWPDALNPIADIRTTEAPKSLVIGGIGDVRTPVSWAVETAESIGGVFLSSSHQGHTTVFSRGNDCVNSIVVDFLLDGSLPANGKSCNRDESVNQLSTIGRRSQLTVSNKGIGTIRKDENKTGVNWLHE